MAISTLVIWGAYHCDGQERNVIGTDLVSALTSCGIAIHFGHAISDKWSAEAEACVNIGRFIKGPEAKETEHWKDLYGSELIYPSSVSTYLTKVSISFCFWPRTAFDGPALIIGGQIKDRGSPDLRIGIGYFCRIWKGLKATLSYTAGILEWSENGHPPDDGLKIGIAYVF